jgi:hypothetical protein
MDEPKVWVFFYGSFINVKVLARGGFKPDRIEVARLSGFDNEGGGVVASGPPAEVARFTNSYDCQVTRTDRCVGRLNRNGSETGTGM